MSDEYSVFNTLAAISLQCLAWGKDDADVKAWRSNFAVHADQGWGPAFQLVAGRPVADAALQAWANAHVTRDQDNDIIAAQRPTKIRDGIISPNLGQASGHFLLLDHVILQALRLIWK